MTTMTRAAGAVMAASLLLACDAPTEPTQLEVTLTSNPDPAQPSASTGVSYKIEGDDNEPDRTVQYPWKTSFVVSIAETGGLAVDITAVNLRVQQASGGIVITPTGGAVEHYQFNSSASSNHLNAHGSTSVGFEVWYDLPNQGREALVTVSLSFQDDDNNSYSDQIQVKVAP
jgi:hypothetical protein